MARSSTTWVPGKSGNPRGRPRRGRSVRELVTRIGQERVLFGNEAPGADGEPVDAVEMTRLEALARVLWNKAIFEENLPAVIAIIERLEGKPVQPVAAKVKAGYGAAPFTADEMAQAQADLDEWLTGGPLGGSEAGEPEGTA